MTKTRIIMRITPDSEITRLQRKLRGLPPRKPFIFAADQQRDRFPQGRSVSDAGIAPPKGKSGRKTINYTKRRSEPSPGRLVEITCLFCGKKSTIQKKAGTEQEYCSPTDGIKKCKNAAASKRARERRKSDA